jgi:DNA-binding NarL/FixJ family response regulator
MPEQSQRTRRLKRTARAGTPPFEAAGPALRERQPKPEQKTGPDKDARLRDQARTEDLRALADALLENADGAVFLTDRDRRILDANGSALKLLGPDVEEAAGRLLDEIFAEDRRERLAETCSKAGYNEFELAGGPVGLSSRSLDLDIGPVYVIRIKDLTDLRALEDELRSEKKRQRNMSVTLKNVIKSVDDEKKSIRDTLSRTVKIELLPTLSKMAREDRPKLRSMYKNVVTERLFDIISDPENPESAALLSLTPAEMNVCRYIQTGLCTKEIAETSNSSFETIQTHRKNIRKKLGLTGEKTALYSYLKNLKSLGEESPAA